MDNLELQINLDRYECYNIMKTITKASLLGVTFHCPTTKMIYKYFLLILITQIIGLREILLIPLDCILKNKERN